MLYRSDPVDIVFFIPSFAGGGAERVVVMLANSFVKKGYHVQLVVLSNEGPYKDQISDEVEVIEMGGRMALGIIKLARHIKISRPDAVFSSLNYANVAAAIAVAISGVNVKLYFNQVNHLSSTLSIAKGFKNALLKLLVYWAYKRPAGIVAVSRDVASDLIRYSPDDSRIHTIHNPAYDPAHEAMAAASVAFPTSQWRDDPYIIAAGRLTPQKDYNTLLSAFQIVVKKRNVRLIILGEGKEYDQLVEFTGRAALSERVWFAGFKSNPFAYIKKAEVFVLSSVSEGFGNVLVEAMGLGTPVVSTMSSGGPAEILEDGRWGALVPKQDPVALANAIIEVLDGNGIDARERAKEFSVDQVIARYLRLLLPDTD